MYKILILAAVQGIAEFLPISSSGHLVILGALLEALSSSVSELGESATLEIILHAGTLGSILVVFWKRILNLLTSDRRVLPLLVIGTVPAAIVGLTIKSQFSTLLTNPTLAAAMLLMTGCMLVVLGRLSPRDGCLHRIELASSGDHRLFSSVRDPSRHQPQWIDHSGWEATGAEK